MSEKSSEKKVSIIGLGQMGRKLAQIYIDNEYEVTVWNRSADKAQGLNAYRVATNVVEALTASQVSIVCVLDNTIVSEIINKVDRALLQGKTIINFTTGSPDDVKELESSLNAAGAHYLNGAIQVAPEQMAMPDTTILMAGNKNTFDQYKPLLDKLGGNIKYLAEHAAASPAMDLATLSWVYGSFLGLMYGVAFCRKEGISLDQYSSVIGEIAGSFLEFYKHEIRMIDSGNYAITQSPMAISIIASQRITDTAKSMGLDTTFTDAIASMLANTKVQGLENEEVAALVKIVEQKSKNRGSWNNDAFIIATKTGRH